MMFATWQVIERVELGKAFFQVKNAALSLF
jgi:hypothetical protein